MPHHPTPSHVPADALPWASWLRLIRFRNQTGTALLLLPTCWSLVLAERGLPSPRLLGIFIAGSFVMRSAGVILNDLADQSFDRHVARTKTRPLASGELTRGQAFLFLGLLLLIAAGLLLLLNPLTIWLAPSRWRWPHFIRFPNASFTFPKRYWAWPLAGARLWPGPRHGDPSILLPGLSLRPPYSGPSPTIPFMQFRIWQTIGASA